MFWDDEEKRPVPNKVLKMKVYERDKGKCRLCGKKVNPFDFEIGHDMAHSRGGKLTLGNALLLHPMCNRSMRTLSLKRARQSIGLPDTPEETTEKFLKSLTLPQLKFLAKEHSVELKGRVESDGWSETRVAPSKTRYVKALARAMTEKQVRFTLAKMPAPTKKKGKKRDTGWNFW